MRNYVQHQSRMRQAYGRLTPLVRIVHNLRERHQARKLLSFSDRQLSDVGLARSDVRQMIRRPLARDENWEREWAQIIRSRCDKLLKQARD
jgi:uncharacterized protein YjiS (DUF1127 family)